jgi:hypothetical protein
LWEECRAKRKLASPGAGAKWRMGETARGRMGDESAPGPVGRKTRRAGVGLAIQLFRAGFEPHRRRATTSSGSESPTLGSREFCVDRTRTHGSNPARSSRRGGFRCPRRDPPPLRFGAALSCVVSRLETGRDVGLAKSGFRPTGPRIVHAASPFRPLAHRRGGLGAFRTGPLSGLGPRRTSCSITIPIGTILVSHQ